MDVSIRTNEREMETGTIKGSGEIKSGFPAMVSHTDKPQVKLIKR